MDTHYSSERNLQILVALMKAHEVKKIVVSPGATNVCLVGSLQSDPYFELYSAADERSAAYIACGMAAETGEPVALSCTGATASRNYLPALTEAYYRKLPILAITSSQHPGRIGSHMPQVIDRSTQLNDIVNVSVQLPFVHDEEDAWACGVQANKALLELRHRGGGPVHINLVTYYSKDFSVKALPPVKVIRRYVRGDSLPRIPRGRVGVIVGAHPVWSEDLLALVESFCEKYNAVVLSEHSGNYKGSHGVMASLVSIQENYDAPCKNMDLLVHIGEISGTFMPARVKKVWRVSPDGEVRDTYRKLTAVFEMREEDFFRIYTGEAAMDGDRPLNRDNESTISQGGVFSQSLAAEWQAEYRSLREKMPDDLPFSNLWIARETAPRLPEGCELHLGILNSLRVWNYFEIPGSVSCFSNTGGFGIDGCLSSLIGASMCDPKRLYFGVVGDLAFFYDMNSLGNRHVGGNLRILLVNNGRGAEFRLYSHPCARFGDDADGYMAAGGHYGSQSRALVRHYAEDLGFEYMSASSREEYLERLDRFVSPDAGRPVLLEAFTRHEDESTALKMANNVGRDAAGAAKRAAREILGDRGVQAVRQMLRR